jgi:hypothetical protein
MAAVFGGLRAEAGAYEPVLLQTLATACAAASRAANDLPPPTSGALQRDFPEARVGGCFN